MVYDRTAQGFFGFNPSVLMAQDPEYAKMVAAVTNAPTYYRPNYNQPIDWTVFNSYDKAGDTGMQGYELEQIYNKMLNGTATSDEKTKLLWGVNNMSAGQQKMYQQLYNDRLDAGSNYILNNEGFSPNMKSWAALNQGNATWSAVGGADPNLKTMEPLGDQLGGILGQAQDLGVNVPTQLLARANARDQILGTIGNMIGGWKPYGMGYNSSFGSGAPTQSYIPGDKDNLAYGNMGGPALGGTWGAPTLNDIMPSATYSDAYNGFGTGWGSGVGYKMGWMPSGTPFKNNSLLETGGNGVYNTGIYGTPQPFNPNSPYGGSWQGQWGAPGFTPPNYIRDTMYGGTSGGGGPSIFSDPSLSGSQQTLNGMDPRYQPDWGAPIQNRGYSNGLISNEKYNQELYQQQLNELMQAYQDQGLRIPPELLYQGGAGYFGGTGSGYGATEEPKFYLPEYSFTNQGSGAGTYYDIPGTRTYNGTPMPATTNDVFNQAYYDTSGGTYTPQPSLATGYNIGALDATYGYNPYQGYTGFAVGPSFDPTNYSLFY